MRDTPFTDPRFLKAFRNLEQAVSYQQQGLFDEAEKMYSRLIKKNPDYFDALHFYGLFKYQKGQLNDALKLVGKAIKVNPRSANAFSSLGVILAHLERHVEALKSFDAALKLEPNHVQALSNRCNSLNELRRYHDAISSSDRALAINPNYSEAYIPRGAALFCCKRYMEALETYDQSLKHNPNLAMGWLGRGNVLDKLKRHEEAADAYAKVLEIEPQHPFIKGMFLHQKMLSCDWKGVGELIAEIDSDVACGKLSAEPFGWQGVAKSQRSLQLCAELYNKNKFPADIRISTRQPLAKHEKIRIGYSSGELREQATSHLIVGVLELHDNSRFDIYGVDNGWDDQSEIRRRINASLNNIIDISQLDDSSAVAAISENQIDILVNLNGYFGEHRTRVFSQRPAPIQVNYLGFPGTLGASYMDYIIADQHVIPDDHKAFYAEKVVYLPNCYQANDQKKEIGTRLFSRVECGLPQKGFVFCCFNNNYKITPEVFDCWIRILTHVEDSVLWLIEDNATVTSNLRKEAVARGVSSERLIFAKRLPLAEHLARHRLADLFLDTLPYNAHTTGSDALWSGLPVLTCLGETFAGRVAASLLNAIRLPELITTTLDAYEQMAIGLATHPEKLVAIKRKVTENRLTTPLFDTKLFTEHIEAAYTTMYERHQAGLAPDHIVVPN